MVLVGMVMACHGAIAGSFAFGDADYACNMQLGGKLGEWQQSLWVLTQVNLNMLQVFDSSLRSRNSTFVFSCTC